MLVFCFTKNYNFSSHLLSPVSHRDFYLLSFKGRRRQASPRHSGTLIKLNIEREGQLHPVWAAVLRGVGVLIREDRVFCLAGVEVLFMRGRDSV